MDRSISELQGKVVLGLLSTFLKLENSFILCKETKASWGFPGGPVVRTQHFHCQGPGSIPGWGTKIRQAMQCGQKK